MNIRVFLYTLLSGLLITSAVVAQKSSGPEVGSMVDEFSLVDQHGTSHKLSSLTKEQPVALVVFRSADW